MVCAFLGFINILSFFVLKKKMGVQKVFPISDR
jgi:hypothetical protein